MKYLSIVLFLPQKFNKTRFGFDQQKKMANHKALHSTLILMGSSSYSRALSAAAKSWSGCCLGGFRCLTPKNTLTCPSVVRGRVYMFTFTNTTQTCPGVVRVNNDFLPLKNTRTCLGMVQGRYELAQSTWSELIKFAHSTQIALIKHQTNFPTVCFVLCFEQAAILRECHLFFTIIKLQKYAFWSNCVVLNQID